jgi:T5SS/PEP-CTERM-associated repeat protein/autotransporter-associated beta strand protein
VEVDQSPGGTTALNVTSDLIVGVNGQGSIKVSNGATISDINAVIGQFGGGSSALVVGDVHWNNSANFQVSGGTLNLLEDAVINCVDAIVGHPTEPSTATIGGNGAIWNVSGKFDVGVGGPGTLNIAAGGVAATNNQFRIHPPGTVSVGTGGAPGDLEAGSYLIEGSLIFNHTGDLMFPGALTGSGIVSKTGAGTTDLTNISSFTGTFAANAGFIVLKGAPNPAATFNANNGGTLRLDSITTGGPNFLLRANAGGTVEYQNSIVNGGSLRGPGTHTLLAAAETTFNGVTAYNSTSILQNGVGNFNNFTNAGSLTNNAPLFFNAGTNDAGGNIIVNNTFNAQDFTSYGVINVTSGGLLNNSVGNLVLGGGSRTTVNSGGSIQLLPGTSLELLGALLVNNGQVSGPVNVNFGALAKGSGSYTTVSVFDGGKFAPGTSPGQVAISSTYTQTDGGTLLAELGGITKGAQYDSLAVTGAANLDGTLDVSLINGFVPASGNSFEVLHANGGITGAFSQVSLPPLGAGLAWNVVYSNVSVTLQVNASIVAGDYNHNGIVDAADYTIWRDTLGSTTDLRANGDNTGASANVINAADYDVWKMHFGQTAGSGSGGAAGVPEPATGSMLLVGILMLCGRRRFVVS